MKSEPCKVCGRVFDIQDMHDLGKVVGIICDDCVTENDFAYYQWWQWHKDDE